MRVLIGPNYFGSVSYTHLDVYKRQVLGPELPARQKATGHVKVPVVLLTPAGRTFTQALAREYESKGAMVMICGRYEGVDERVSELVVTDHLSIGDYVLSGGEIPAMAIVEAITRLVPGVLGDMRAVIEDSHSCLLYTSRCV